MPSEETIKRELVNICLELGSRPVLLNCLKNFAEKCTEAEDKCVNHWFDELGGHGHIWCNPKAKRLGVSRKLWKARPHRLFRKSPARFHGQENQFPVKRSCRLFSRCPVNKLDYARQVNRRRGASCDRNGIDGFGINIWSGLQQQDSYKYPSKQLWTGIVRECVENRRYPRFSCLWCSSIIFFLSGKQSFDQWCFVRRPKYIMARSCACSERSRVWYWTRRKAPGKLSFLLCDLPYALPGQRKFARSFTTPYLPWDWDTKISKECRLPVAGADERGGRGATLPVQHND